MKLFEFIFTIYPIFYLFTLVKNHGLGNVKREMPSSDEGNISSSGVAFELSALSISILQTIY